MKYIFIFLSAAVMSVAVNAGILDCGLQTINVIYVQSERPDGSIHQNKLLIIMGSDKSAACEDVDFGYMDIDDPAFSGILSMSLAARMAGEKIRIVVNDSSIGRKTHRIEWMNL